MENYTVANRTFWVTIKVYGGKYPTDQILEIYSWKGPWHVRKKWNWYFKYRAALFQVQNPKNLVEFFCGSEEPDLRTRRDFIKLKIVTTKRMLTKLTNELEKHKEWLLSYNIFGLEGDDGRIIKAERKIEKYRTELEILEDELNNLN